MFCLNTALVHTYFVFKDECPENAIVPYYRLDRFGANYERLIKVYIYAKLTNRPFCFTLFGADYRMYGYPVEFKDRIEYFLWIGGQYYGPAGFKHTDEKYITHSDSHEVKESVKGNMYKFQNDIRNFFFYEKLQNTYTQ